MSRADMVSFLDAYETECFAFSPGGHRVAMSHRDRLAKDLLPLLPLAGSRTPFDPPLPSTSGHRSHCQGPTRPHTPPSR
ncbi:hypothetical protein ACFVT2_13165 [Streptomyces sp. NPDC058000]|uniref:hypothetical protein n=1 Tax=Streptomyces sp. NPDC058000 TaxID=3346299 RepID=UPI0036E211BC